LERRGARSGIALKTHPSFTLVKMPEMEKWLGGVAPTALKLFDWTSLPKIQLN